MSGITPTGRREHKPQSLRAWDEIFGELQAQPGTESLQAQHKKLWERIRKRGSEMTEQEEQELNRLFVAIYPHLLQGRGQEKKRLLPEQTDEPLNDIVVPHKRRKQQQTKGKRVFDKLNRYHQKLGSSPIINWFLGALTLLLWASGTVVQIQTSEYLALGGDKKVAGVAWNVLVQPYLLVTGQAPIEVVTAWEYGWVVELVTLVFALALTAAVMKISSVNYHLAKWFVIAGGILILLNGWADYSSSPGSNWLVQFLIALAIGGIVVVGLPLGIGLIEKGFEEL